MKILVIFTGGTIGSDVVDNLITPDRDSKSVLVQGMSNVEFDYLEPYFILSEQLSGINITKLVECVGENLTKYYDGIIVTHGTDTLQYSSAALSLAYGDCKIPVVLVSSNYVLSDSRANGSDNFKYAVEFIRQGIGGVFVSYRNTGELPKIHIASELLEHEIYTDDVKSIGGPYGYFENDKFIKLRDYIARDSVGKFTLSEFSNVLWLKAYPGMKSVDTEGYKAVLLQGYHSGTLPTHSDEFASLCKGCKAPIYFLGAKDGLPYESTREFSELNIKIIPKIAPVYAYIKLWYLTDKGENLEKIMD